MADTINDDVERALAAFGGNDFTYHTFGTFSIRPRVRIVTLVAPIVEPAAGPEPLMAMPEVHAIAVGDSEGPMDMAPALTDWDSSVSPAAEAVQFQPAPPAGGDWGAPSPHYAPPPAGYYDTPAAAAAPPPVVPGYSVAVPRLLQGDSVARLQPPPPPDRWAVGGREIARPAPLAERFAIQAARAAQRPAELNIFQMAWDSAEDASAAAAARPRGAPGAPVPMPGEQDLFRRL